MIMCVLLCYPVSLFLFICRSYYQQGVLFLVSTLLLLYYILHTQVLGPPHVFICLVPMSPLHLVTVLCITLLCAVTICISNFAKFLKYSNRNFLKFLKYQYTTTTLRLINWNFTSQPTKAVRNFHSYYMVIFTFLQCLKLCTFRKVKHMEIK